MKRWNGDIIDVLEYELAANGGRDSRISERPGLWLHGDFAAGVRGSGSDAGVRGDFATGMRITPLLMTIGNFATGMRTRPDAELVRADFATGQRTERSPTPSRSARPTRRGLSRLRPASGPRGLPTRTSAR